MSHQDYKHAKGHPEPIDYGDNVVATSEVKVFNNFTPPSFKDMRKEIPRKFSRLNQFFHNQLILDDISRFSELKIAEGSFEAKWVPMSDIVTMTATTNLTLLWQFDSNAPVNSVNLNGSLSSFVLGNVVPRHFAARRIALIAYNEDEVIIALNYILNGVVSSTDPIHELLREGRRE